MGWREKIDAVIAPAKLSRKIRDRHHLDYSDADARQLCQLIRGGAPCSFLGERADVHLVDDFAFQFLSGPFCVRPLELRWIDNAGRAVWSIGLKPGRGIGMTIFGLVSAKPVATAGSDMSDAGKIPIFFSF